MLQAIILIIIAILICGVPRAKEPRKRKASTAFRSAAWETRERQREQQREAEISLRHDIDKINDNYLHLVFRGEELNRDEWRGRLIKAFHEHGIEWLSASADTLRLKDCIHPSLYDFIEHNGASVELTTKIISQ